MQTPTPLEHTTVWGLVSEASLVVQAVMLCLALASLLSWYLIIQRGSRLRRSEAHSRAFLKQFRESEVGQLYHNLDSAEQLIELGYGYQATPWLTLRSNLQYIIEPGAFSGQDIDNALVVGLQVKAAL